MTLEEARTVCENAAWTRNTPLIELFDELVEEDADEVKSLIGSYPIGQATGLIVAVVLGLRQKMGLDLYELKEKGK